MKKSSFLLFIFAIFFLSCNNTKVENIISDISTDFPTSEKLELKFFNKYDILSDISNCFVDDSVLWVESENGENFGYCYNLNTTAQLSAIATRGKASYEFIDVRKIILLGDSIQFHTQQDIIKTFAKKDIIENKPMDQRKFSMTPVLDTIFVLNKIKLPNSSILATMCGTVSGGGPINVNYDKYYNSEFNKKMVAVISSKETNAYNTINYKKYDIKEENSGIENLDFQIKFTLAKSHIGIKDNNMAVFSLEYQPLLYTFDLKSGKVVNEKLYSKLFPERFGIMNEMRLGNFNMKCNDKYILCCVSGYLSKEDKEAKTVKKAILVFDWDLNPIKKFDLPSSDKNRNTYFISEDCKTVYSWKMEEKGLVLSKSDLNY